MATSRSSPAPGVFQLPITGRRGDRRVLAGWALVLDDEFTRTVLVAQSWCFDHKGYPYRMVTREGRHETVWLHQAVYRHYFGPVPAGLEIDHIDRDPGNNLPMNLRAVSRSINVANGKRRRDNTTGFRGVCWHKPSKSWRGEIQVRGRRISLGYHATARKAADAVNEAYRRYFPEVQMPNP
jgi:hypothetical protein